MATKGCEENVELGFVEDTNPDLLRSHYFPSKVGGKPSWLSLKQLPNDLNCKVCGKPTFFLMQVYSSNDNSSAFHRTLFVFVCRNPNCSVRNSNSNLLVFRSQLPRTNEFYSADAPVETDVTPGPIPAADLCAVCGCLGPKRCAQCHLTAYCSKQHQMIDWKNGHKSACSAKPGMTVQRDLKGVLFPEYELVTEAEDTGDNQSDDEKDSKGEKGKWQEYHNFLKSDKAGSLLPHDIPKSELDQMATAESLDDKVFNRFKERIKKDPEQVLRFQKGGQPLWVSSNHIPSDKDIPACSCGAPRQFEFQVMPQMLSHLEVDQLGDSLDWGTLCVYTCSVSCDIGHSYQPEFVWKQDYSNQK